LFCVSRYGWGWDKFTQEANTGEGIKMKNWMRFYLTWILPVIVLFIFAFGIYDKFFK
ncbi:MAG: sodium-dependent transporter, partial [Sphaerochaetaceae bacterium]|nr:sodium-dependent transporter [Sphaerochaetaceae bacterium]